MPSTLAHLCSDGQTFFFSSSPSSSLPVSEDVLFFVVSLDETGKAEEFVDREPVSREPEEPLPVLPLLGLPRRSPV